jgi:dolichol-phosphate mannosyltransferase
MEVLIRGLRILHNEIDMNVVIVMPTYNEAACIGDMVHVLFARIFPAINGATMHLLIVDDDSPDGTGAAVRAMAPRYGRLHLLTGTRKGLGWAYVRGMKYAMEVLRADAVMEMDADFQHDPGPVPLMVEKLLGGSDYVIGSRYAAGGSVPGSWPWHRKFLSMWGNRALGHLLGGQRLHDYTTGFRLTRVKGVLDQIDLESLRALERFAFKIDLLCRTLNFARRIEEIPIHFQERRAGTTKFSWRELTATGGLLCRLRGRNFPRAVPLK